MVCLQSACLIWNSFSKSADPQAGTSNGTIKSPNLAKIFVSINFFLQNLHYDLIFFLSEAV